MREGRDSINSVDEYIMQFSVPIQEVLQELRRVIKDSAPEADEKMSYKYPHIIYRVI